MANTERAEMLQDIERLFRVGTAAGLSDGQLLERFAGPRDGCAELAFTALVERHGPMVLRVCRGVLRDPHDADDAFQATFLVLARRARSIRRHESVGSWLYGVALRVAWEARSAAARHRRHLQKAAALSPHSVVDPEPDDLGRIVHEEVGRLPAHYRAAVILCDLEEHSCEEAARLLGWPVGTVKSRLARGRERLRPRLARRGLDPSLLSFTLAGALASPSSSVPAALAEATVRAALCESTQRAAAAGIVSAAVAALTEGVIRAMFVAKAKLIAAILLALVTVAAGTGVAARQRPRPARARAGVGVATAPVSPPFVPDSASETPLLVAQADRTVPSVLGESGEKEPGQTSLRELAIRLKLAERIAKIRDLEHKDGAPLANLEMARAEVEILKARIEEQGFQLEEELQRLEGRLEVKRAELALARSRLTLEEERFRNKHPVLPGDLPGVEGGIDETAIPSGEVAIKQAELREIEILKKHVLRRMRAHYEAANRRAATKADPSKKRASVALPPPPPPLERTDVSPAQPK